MSPVVDLVIRTPFEGAEEKFVAALAERAVREQHWAGPSGLGGDVQQRSRLDEVLEAHLNLEAYHEADLRHAARILRARFPGDEDMMTLASHIESWEVYAAEQAEKELSRDMNTMESFLREHGVPMVRPGSVLDSREDQGRAWPRNNAGQVHEPQSGPRTTAPLMYPVQARPLDDREARGAREPAMSEKLRSLAREVSGMARLSSNARQRNRLLQRAGELQRMSLRQYQRELESEVATADDPDEAGNALNRIARDAANDSGDGDGDHQEFSSFDDWSGTDRSGSEQRAEDDVDQQRAELDLGEDVPRGLPPRPGERVTDDQLGSPAAGMDEPAGAMKNAYDDDVLIHSRKGLRRGAENPHGPTRFARAGQMPGRRYSAFESMREGADLTRYLLDDMAVWYAAGFHHF